MSSPLYDLEIENISGESYTLDRYRDKVLLIVNVASQCGFTGQYKNLENLHNRFGDQGLVILGFPCNQFGSQEPGSNQDIANFCSLEYGVSFPMHAKIDVNGPSQHPLYALLTEPSAPFPGKIRWNFSKFLVSRQGEVFERFGSMTNPESRKVVVAIENALSDPRG